MSISFSRVVKKGEKSEREKEKADKVLTDREGVVSTSLSLFLSSFHSHLEETNRRALLERLSPHYYGKEMLIARKNLKNATYYEWTMCRDILLRGGAINFVRGLKEKEKEREQEQEKKEIREKRIA